MKIESVLVRLGEDELAGFISKPALAMLAEINSELLHLEKIRNMVQSKVESEAMLRNMGMRNILFEALRLEEARELATKLGLSDFDQPYDTLCKAQIRRNSDAERALFGFFETRVPDPESTTHTVDTEIIEPDMGLFPTPAWSREEDQKRSGRSRTQNHASHADRVRQDAYGHARCGIIYV